MSIQKETELFFNYIMRKPADATDLINAKYTFLNQRLAEFYGIPGVKGAGVPESGSHRHEPPAAC